MRTITTICGLLLMGTLQWASAQEDAAALAKTEAARLTTELGLDEKQSAAVYQRLLETEKQLVDQRAECAKIQAIVDETMGRTYDGMADMLTPEQQAKLETMRKTGALKSGCSPGAAKSCGDHGAGKSAGCCSGGKAEASPAKDKEAPAKVRTSISK